MAEDLSKFSDQELLAVLRSRQPDPSNMSDEDLLARVQPSFGERLGNVARAADDTVRTVARGIPFVGEWLDEANAKTKALVGGGKYEDLIAQERARDAKIDKDHPYLSLGGRAVGAIGGTVAAAPLAAGSALGGALLGTGARTVGGAIGRGAVAGATQGAAAGAGRAGVGESMTEGAVRDAASGAVLGGAIPAAVAGGKSVYNRVVPERYNDVLSSVPAKARDWAVSQFGSPQSVQAMRDRMRELGPQAMPADVSPEMLMIARGAASRPGTRDTVINAMQARDQGKNARLASAADEALGPVPRPSAINAGIDEGQGALSPAYEGALRNARAVDTTQLAQHLEAAAVNTRGEAQRVLRQVRGMLDIPTNPGNLDPHPRALLATRHAIDGMAETAKDPNALRVLGIARRAVDGILTRAVPGIKDVDARFAELARQREALQRGTQVLDSGKTAVRPDDLRQEITQGAIPQGNMVGPSAVPARMRQGTRAEIDRVLGTQANDISAAHRLLKGEGDWNRDKMRAVFGSDRANRFMRTMDSEATMQDTGNRVMRGSDTAPAAGFERFLSNAADGTSIPTETTITGALLRGGQKALQAVTGSSNKAKAGKFSEALAKLAIAQGRSADEVLAALMARAGRPTTGSVAGGNAALGASLLGRDALRSYLDDQAKARRQPQRQGAR